MKTDEDGESDRQMHYLYEFRGGRKETLMILRAYHIGERAFVSKGYICIDMYAEGEEIEELIQYSYSTKWVSQRIAYAACEKYKAAFGEEFILSFDCVAKEIEDHIEAYRWATGTKALPNKIALGFMIHNFLIEQDKYDAKTVRGATVAIDIKEEDVKKDGYFSQSSIWDYKDGINPIYRGTNSDPWADER